MELKEEMLLDRIKNTQNLQQLAFRDLASAMDAQSVSASKRLDSNTSGLGHLLSKDESQYL